MKPLFFDKIKPAENITLDKNDKLVRDKEEVTNIFNDVFVHIVSNFGDKYRT